MERALIELRGVEVGYGARPLFGSLDWSIDAGARVALVGPSGSGKTSLLNLIGGLDRPRAGTVTVAGQNLGELSDEALSRYRATRVGFVFQAFHLRPERTVLDNMLVPLYFRPDISWGEGKRRAEELLERVDLAGFGPRPVRELSGGQRQRVALARALVHRPDLLLADEPVGNLDAETSRLVIELLQAENEQRNLTVVLVTHDTILLDLAQRIDVLKDGRLAAA